MTYITEFPTFPPADMISLPVGWADISWGNETCPCFENEDLGLRLWVDFKNPSLRMFECPRFTLRDFESNELLSTDSLVAIMAHVADCQSELAHQARAEA